MINPISNIVRSGIFKVTGRHVCGHQDENFTYENLDWCEQHNVNMDLLTKSLLFEKRRNMIRNKYTSVAPGERLVVIVNKNKISGNYTRAMHDIVQGYTILTYWKKSGRFPVEQNTNIY